MHGFAVLQEEHHTPFRLNTCCVPGLCQRICPVSPTGPRGIPCTDKGGGAAITHGPAQTPPLLCGHRCPTHHPKGPASRCAQNTAWACCAPGHGCRVVQNGEGGGSKQQRLNFTSIRVWNLIKELRGEQNSGDSTRRRVGGTGTLPGAATHHPPLCDLLEPPLITCTKGKAS